VNGDVYLLPDAEGPIASAIGVDSMLDLLRSLQQPLPHLHFGPWSVSKAPRNNEYGDLTVFKKRPAEVRVRIRLGPNQGLQSTVRTLAGVAVPPLDREALRSYADFAGTLVESLGVIQAKASDRRRRTDILPENIDIGSLAVGRYLRTVSHLPFDPTPVLLHLRALSQQTYEGHKVAYGLILTRRKGGVGEFPGDIEMNKRYRSVSDGERTALRLDREGKVLGLTSLPPGDEMPVRSYRPRRFDELAAGSYREVMGMGLSLEGDIVCLQKADMSVSLRQGRWQIWNHQENVNVLKRAIQALDAGKTRRRKSSAKYIDQVVRQVYSAALDLSFRRRGGLFVMVESPEALPNLIDRSQQPHDESRAISDLGLDRTLQRQYREVASLPRDVLVDLAGLDGAVIVSAAGRVLAYGAIIKLSPEGGASSRGARWQACLEASRYGLAMMVSADGAISIVARGKQILSL
jgi:DNA integrity scanning protein DisA with diadenylate cyclase activity